MTQKRTVEPGRIRIAQNHARRVFASAGVSEFPVDVFGARENQSGSARQKQSTCGDAASITIGAWPRRVRAASVTGGSVLMLG